ncbi:phosphoglucomutase/phosphomannomutase family protein [Pantanalinema sp. GBBB05]|uniref:phosphoglucomutase/phosphomannomutase family protein n=1 Tax=Pantanalinema sp. GBBB05 TaxID=2604139 RepID=UPI001DC90681|nr:phosphoglucomutase/phosphomannomutase family protein [Pantanalinema sp. GBBB05]
MSHPSPLSSIASGIKFGTDGWRGVIAADFTFDRLKLVAPIAAQVLADTYGSTTQSRLVIVGYDRRFLSEEFAQATAEAVCMAGFDVLLSDRYAPTPAFSWAAKQFNALGALVITASHNPGKYSGLKIKSAFGGSVPPSVTQQVEARLAEPLAATATPGKLEMFNPWLGYCEGLRPKVNIAAIREAIQQGRLTVFADVMHGAAAGGLAQLLEVPIHEINSDRDPLFEGGSPEPLPRYLTKLSEQVAQSHQGSTLTVGLAFDGDSDRIAAMDSQGNFLSSQILIPILIEHLVKHHNFQGEVVKTLSGSDLMPKVAALHGLSVFETAIGYKYIADRMLETQVLLGGEESGGIGYGTHIPERDALLSALYVLEAIVQFGADLSDLYCQLQQRCEFISEYDRIDLPLANMEARARLLHQLQTQPLTEVAGRKVIDCNPLDGYKLRLADQSWLLIRFSGTEPVLRLYCEAATLETVHATLNWAKAWADKA